MNKKIEFFMNSDDCFDGSETVVTIKVFFPDSMDAIPFTGAVRAMLDILIKRDERNEKKGSIK